MKRTRCFKFLFSDSRGAQLGLRRCWGGTYKGHFWCRCNYLDRCLQQSVETYIQTPQARTYKTPWMVLKVPRKG